MNEPELPPQMENPSTLVRLTPEADQQARRLMAALAVRVLVQAPFRSHKTVKLLKHPPSRNRRDT
jgi:hypothetical protein